MTDGLRVAVIGGGSTYTPDLIDGMIKRAEELPIDHLALMDIAPERLQVVASMAERMLRAAGLATGVATSLDLGKTIAGSDFVLTQIRVGRMTARIRDERLSLSLGLIGQETTGLGGFANALRTIPPSLEIAESVAQHAPSAWLINFSNPSGIVTEALLKHATNVRCVGVCDVPTTLHRIIADVLGVGYEGLRTDYFGLNHLGWVRDAEVNGASVWSNLFGDRERFSELLERLNTRTHFRRFDEAVVRRLGLLPSIYLTYFYYPEEMLRGLLDASMTRGEQVEAIESELLERYANVQASAKPRELALRRATYYSAAALDVMSAIANNRRAEVAVITRNNNAITDLAADVSIERNALIDGDGVTPIPMGRLPDAVRGLVQVVKAYEELTVAAAVHVDLDAAVEALAVHPLISGYSRAQRAMEAVLREFADLLPRWRSVATGLGFSR